MAGIMGLQGELWWPARRAHPSPPACRTRSLRARPAAGASASTRAGQLTLGALQQHVQRDRIGAVRHPLAPGPASAVDPTTYSLMWPQVQEDHAVPQAVDKANYKKLWG